MTTPTKAAVECALEICDRFGLNPTSDETLRMASIITASLPQWISIGDGLPEDGEPKWVSDGAKVRMASFHPRFNRWVSWPTGGYENAVSYWQHRVAPLPPQPEDGR